MDYPDCRTVEEAVQVIDKKVVNGNIGKIIAADITGEILRISMSYHKEVPVVTVVSQETVGTRFLFFKKTALKEVRFTLENGWKHQYPDPKTVDFYPANQMISVLYDRKTALASKIK
jgi:hypothetical protein